MYYEDRLHGGGFARVMLAGAARARRRRGAAARSRGAPGISVEPWIRGPRRRWPIASTRRRSCSTCWRHSSACCCAKGRWPSVLRTNLSTRPFYNERAVRVGIAVVALLGARLTVFNAAEICRSERAEPRSRQTVRANEAQARDLRQQAQVDSQALNKQELEAVQAAAREANELIDRRAFSWTDSSTVSRHAAAGRAHRGVQPQVDADGRMLVADHRHLRGVSRISTRSSTRWRRPARSRMCCHGRTRRGRRHAAVGAAGLLRAGAAAARLAGRSGVSV